MFFKKILVLIFIFCFSVNSFGEIVRVGWMIFKRPFSTQQKTIEIIEPFDRNLSGIFYNSVLYETIKDRKIFMMTQLGASSDAFGGLIFVQPVSISKVGTLSIGIIYYDARQMTLNWIDSRELKEKTVRSNRDILGNISCGQVLIDRFLVGGTLKFANSNIAEIRMASYYTGDMGFLFNPEYLNGLSLSIAGQNIVTSGKFINKFEELPMSAWFGVSYRKNIFINEYIGVGFKLPYIIKEKKTMHSIEFEYEKDLFLLNVSRIINDEDSVFQIEFIIKISKKTACGFTYISENYISNRYGIDINRLKINIGFKL